MFLIDASVWVAAGDPDDRFHRDATAIALDVETPVAAMDLTFYEIANVGAREGQPGEARRMLRVLTARCGDNIVAIDMSLISLAMEIATEHGLTAYDAAYVAAARRDGWTLVSADIADLVSKGLAVAPDEADYPKSR
jgi:predicted nucleic acid-binding protein